MAEVVVAGVTGVVLALFFSPEIAKGLKRRRRREARRRNRDAFD